MSLEDLLQGSDLQHKRDYKRLSRGYQRVFNTVKDGAWRTPEQIETASGIRWDSAARYLRYMKAAGHKKEMQYIADGVYQYRIVPFTK